jgi:hypothetical protein
MRSNQKAVAILNIQNEQEESLGSNGVYFKCHIEILA